MTPTKRIEGGRSGDRRLQLALGGAAIAAAATALGFAMGLGREGEAATAWGVLAGMGAVSLLIALAIAVVLHFDRRCESAGEGRRDRMQTERVWQVSIFAAAGLVFLTLALRRLDLVLSGDGDWSDRLYIALPVLYAWVTMATVLGWDHYSRKNRRFLEDELTAALRARAVVAGLLVLMVGASMALGVLLFDAVWGARVLLASLTLAGATAGLRFAWLDREMSRGV